MKKLSILALAAAITFGAPTYAQDTSPSSEVSANVEPSVDPSIEVSASSEGGETIDTSLDIEITPEQTAQIRQFVVETNVQPVAVDFEIAVGASVPATVTLTPLPMQIAAVVPGIEGYFFFLADGRIVIVSPATLKVVLIIYA